MKVTHQEVIATLNDLMQRHRREREEQSQRHLQEVRTAYELASKRCGDLGHIYGPEEVHIWSGSQRPHRVCVVCLTPEPVPAAEAVH